MGYKTIATTSISPVYGALEDYTDALKAAGWAYSNSIFGASRVYDTSLVSAENTYTNASFNAQKVATLSYYDAAISELTQTLDLESKQKADEAMYCNLLATTQAEIIDNLFEDLEEITPDDGDSITNWLGTLGTTGAAATSVLSTENSARSGRNSTNTTTLNNLKATLKTERETAEAAADRLYRNTEQSAWNGYLTSVQSANTVYLGSIKTAENTYKTAVDTADTAYRSASITAYISFQETVKTLDTAFYAAVADADDPTFTTTAYFTTTGANPNLPYQKTALANTSKAVDHEDCPYCHGKGTYTVSTGGMGMVGLVYTGDPTSTVPCDHQPPAITSSELYALKSGFSYMEPPACVCSEDSHTHEPWSFLNTYCKGWEKNFTGDAHIRVAYGCGGIMSVRAGLNGPMQIYDKGILFSDPLEAYHYLQQQASENPSSNYLFVVLQHGGTMVGKYYHMGDSVFSSQVLPIGTQAPCNFVSLIQTQSYPWCWEDASGPFHPKEDLCEHLFNCCMRMDSVNQGVIKHSWNFPANGYPVHIFVVIPNANIATPTDIPDHVFETIRDTFGNSNESK